MIEGKVNSIKMLFLWYCTGVICPSWIKSIQTLSILDPVLLKLLLIVNMNTFVVIAMLSPLRGMYSGNLI